MDLNEKLAARRRELEVQSKEAEREAEAKIRLEMPKRREEQALDGELQKALNAAAFDRMLIGDYFLPFTHAVFAIGGFIIAWWLGLTFIVFGVGSIYGRIDQHKKHIINQCHLNITTNKKESIEYLKQLKNGSINIKVTKLPTEIPTLGKVLLSIGTLSAIFLILIWCAVTLGY